MWDASDTSSEEGRVLVSCLSAKVIRDMQVLAKLAIRISPVLAS